MSDFISKRELYRKIGEAYNKGHLSWGANEIFKDIIGECDSVENKGDLISRQAIIDAIQKLNIPEDMCVFEIISHIEVAIATLPSVEKYFDGMTNGEVIISLYPNLKYIIRNGRVITTIGVASSFDLEWWNAPYKAESEDKE